MSLLRTYLLASLTCAGLACSGPAKPSATTPEQPTAVQTGDSATSEAIAALADQLESAAQANEPAVTAVLQELASTAGAELIGLEHRLKKRPSMLRKIRLQEGPVEDIVISDALRYTMRIEDEPEGDHVKTLVDVVAALESKGHRIVKLKNYWPKGDNYSGVNSVLKSPSGLLWELQFHTADSLLVQKATRAAYEELRQASTTVERKRELFDQMSVTWDEVHVPVDILLPQSLHSTEQIILRPRP